MQFHTCAKFLFVVIIDEKLSFSLENDYLGSYLQDVRSMHTYIYCRREHILPKRKRQAVINYLLTCSTYTVIKLPINHNHKTLPSLSSTVNPVYPLILSKRTKNETKYIVFDCFGLRLEP